jgi:hypothetical protein
MHLACWDAALSLRGQISDFRFYRVYAYLWPQERRRAAFTADLTPEWLKAKRVKTPILMRPMRHESIQTTMAYYVSLECDEIAEQLWGVGSVLGSVAASGPKPGRGVNDTTLC